MSSIDTNVIIYILSTIALLLIVWVVRLELKLKRLTRGKNGGSIEDAIKSIDADLKNFGLFRRDIERYLETVEKRLKRSVQGVHNVSFKAFKGMDSGGNQSFATALLNEKGDGVIISTLHARDRVNVFSKEVRDFKALLSLTEEEQSALTKAQESCKL